MNNIYIFLNMSKTNAWLEQIMGPKEQMHGEKEDNFLTVRYKWEKIIFDYDLNRDNMWMCPTLSLARATLASATALTENGNKPIDILMQLNTAMIVYACRETIRWLENTSFASLRNVSNYNI